MTLVGPDQHDRQLEYTRTHPVVAAGPRVGQRCVYMSAVTEDAVDRLAALCRQGPSGWWTILFSADLNQSKPGGAYYVTDQQVKTLRDAGAVIGSWCDGDQTPISAAKTLAARPGFDFPSAQFETCQQYDLLVASGVPLGVGNPSELKADCPKKLEDAIARTNAGELVLIGEVMRADPTYSAEGVNIASALLYIDRDAKVGGYQPLERFAVMPAGLRRACSIYTGGRASQADLDLYAEWTKP